MTIAIVPSEEFEHTPSVDAVLAPEFQTTFLLRTLTQRERAEIADRAFERVQDPETGESVVRVQQGTQAHLALRYAMRGTRPDRPLRSATGDAVPYEQDLSGVVTDGFLRQIPWEVQLEIGDEIVRRSSLSSIDLGKFVPSQFSSSEPESPSAPTSAGESAPGTPQPTAAQPTPTESGSDAGSAPSSGSSDDGSGATPPATQA
ncbi:MAG: hypothetical protein AAFP86_12070 [Planctomycetota bacterium]